MSLALVPFRTQPTHYDPLLSLYNVVFHSSQPIFFILVYPHATPPCLPSNVLYINVPIVHITLSMSVFQPSVKESRGGGRGGGREEGEGRVEPH